MPQKLEWQEKKHASFYFKTLFPPFLLTLTLFWGLEGKPTNPEYNELCHLHGTFPFAF